MAQAFNLQAAIKSLAVSYLAYTEASAKQDGVGIRIWAERLLENQMILGVEMYPAQSIRNHISAYQESNAEQVPA